MPLQHFLSVLRQHTLLAATSLIRLENSEREQLFDRCKGQRCVLKHHPQTTFLLLTTTCSCLCGFWTLLEAKWTHRPQKSRRRQSCNASVACFMGFAAAVRMQSESARAASLKIHSLSGASWCPFPTLTHSMLLMQRGIQSHFCFLCIADLRCNGVRPLTARVLVLKTVALFLVGCELYRSCHTGRKHYEYVRIPSFVRRCL